MVVVFVMRLIKIILIVVIVIILILTILTIATSRGFSEITDLIHKDTENVHVKEGYNFTDPKLERYQINGVLLIPYARQNPFKSNEKYNTYSLRLASYKQKENDNKVIINRVTVEGINDIKFIKIDKILNEKSEFSNDNISLSENILMDEINNYDMELTDKSQIKVLLNVSVEENGNITTRDLEYIFETKTRKYLIQR